MKIRSRLPYTGILLFLGSLASGCATVPMTSVDEDAAAKTFAVPPDKAVVYLYRNESFGSAISMLVTLDGRVAGKTGPKTYFMWEVEPGSHELVSHTENTSTIQVPTEAGKAYFVWQEVKMGAWAARSLLQQVDEETGRKGVAQCKRAVSNP